MSVIDALKAESYMSNLSLNRGLDPGVSHSFFKVNLRALYISNTIFRNMVLVI